MEIENIKDLQQVIKICRKLGVQSIRIGDIELHLGADPFTKRTSKASKEDTRLRTDGVSLGEIDEHTKIEITGELTQEQLLFGSADPTVWGDTQ